MLESKANIVANRHYITADWCRRTELDADGIRETPGGTARSDPGRDAVLSDALLQNHAAQLRNDRGMSGSLGAGSSGERVISNPTEFNASMAAG